MVATQPVHAGARREGCKCVEVMAKMRVTCPESAHLEEVELVIDPQGIRVRRCTALEGDGEMTCSARCAARLDRRRRDSGELVGRIMEVTSCLR